MGFAPDTAGWQNALAIGGSESAPLSAGVPGRGAACAL